MADESEGNPLITALEFAGLIFTFLIGAFIYTNSVTYLPNTILTNSTNIIYVYTFGTFDKSSIFLFIILLFIDLLISWRKPNIVKGFGNIFLILAFGFLFPQIRSIASSIYSPLAFTQLLPYTSSIFNNNYLVILIFMMLIACTVLNFRKVEGEEHMEREISYADMQ